MSISQLPILQHVTLCFQFFPMTLLCFQYQPYYQSRLCFQGPVIKPLCYISTIQPSQLFTRCRRTAIGLILFLSVEILLPLNRRQRILLPFTSILHLGVTAFTIPETIYHGFFFVYPPNTLTLPWIGSNFYRSIRYAN